MRKESRIKIFTGHFGSGKTELAINLALKQRRENSKVAIADLDVINPYFRTRDASANLEKLGVELVAPKDRFKNADLPIVSAEIYKFIDNPVFQLIVDPGGDKDGAIALGQYYNDWIKHDPEVYFVLNANRPYVSSLEGALHTIDQIEKASRLKVTGIINNSNVGGATSIEDVRNGLNLSNKVAKQLQIPVLYTAIAEQFKEEMAEFMNEHEVRLIYRYMKLPWSE